MIFAPDCLEGKRVLVSGASSGLGQATAVQMSRCGASIVLCGRDRERLEATLSDLSGSDHQVVAADISSADTAYAMTKTAIADGGPLHGVFYSAGQSTVAPVRLTKDKHLDEAFGAAVFGAFGVARAVSGKGALVDKGSLIFMSSVAATRGRQGMSAYSASKAAIGGLVRSMAIELAPRGIRVNGIAAGAVATAMHNNFADNVNEEMLASYRNLHLLGFGEPDDVANYAVFLMSDAARWVTGQDILLDGGYTAK